MGDVYLLTILGLSAITLIVLSLVRDFFSFLVSQASFGGLSNLGYELAFLIIAISSTYIGSLFAVAFRRALAANRYRRELSRVLRFIQDFEDGYEQEAAELAASRNAPLAMAYDKLAGGDDTNLNHAFDALNRLP